MISSVELEADGQFILASFNVFSYILFSIIWMTVSDCTYFWISMTFILIFSKVITLWSIFKIIYFS